MKSHCVQLKVVCLSLALGLVIVAGCSKQESSPDNETAKPKEATKAVQTGAPAEAVKVAEKVQEKAADTAAEAEKAAAKTEKVVEEAKEAASDKSQEETTVNLRLAAADMFDGLPDKIISKCPSCALAMDGNAEFAVEMNGYKLYFCTAACKKAFEEDPVKAVLGLELPKK